MLSLSIKSALEVNKGLKNKYSLGSAQGVKNNHDNLQLGFKKNHYSAVYASNYS